MVPTPTPGGAAHIVQPPCTKRLPCVYTCKTGGQCCRCCRCPVAMVTLTTLARGNVRAEGTTVHTVCVCVCVVNDYQLMPSQAGATGGARLFNRDPSHTKKSKNVCVCVCVSVCVCVCSGWVARL